MPLDHDPLFRWCAFTLLMMIGSNAWVMVAVLGCHLGPIALGPLTCWCCVGLCLAGAFLGGRKIGKHLRG